MLWISLVLSLFLIGILILEFFKDRISNDSKLLKIRKSLLILGILVVSINFYSDTLKEAKEQKKKIKQQIELLNNVSTEIKVNLEFAELLSKEFPRFYKSKGFIARRFESSELRKILNLPFFNENEKQGVIFTISKIQELNKFMDAAGGTAGEDKKTNLDGISEILRMVYSNLINLNKKFEEVKRELENQA